MKCTFLHPLVVNNGQQRSAKDDDEDDDDVCIYSIQSGNRLGYRRHALTGNLIFLTTLIFLLALIGLCTAASGGGENKDTAKGSSSNHLHQQQQFNNGGGGGGGGSGGYSMEDDDDNHQKLQHRHSGLLAAWPTMPLTKYGSGGGGGGGNDLHHRHSSTGNAKTSSSSSVGGGGGGGGGYIPGPFFEPVFATNVSVLAGQSVLLQCRVMELGDRVVSWVRQSDLAILASGGISHTSDNRITATADETLTDWELRIAEVQTKDAGLYECQVNTEPKINWPVVVHVEAAVASIVGTAELYVRTGSTISLTCIIQGSGTIPPRILFWFHNSRPIALDSPRGGISLETERTTTGMSSKLLLTRATLQDAGNYTCAPPGAQPAQVTVHVLNGEHPAAMQRGNRSPGAINGVGPTSGTTKCLWTIQMMVFQYMIQLWVGTLRPPTAVQLI